MRRAFGGEMPRKNALAWSVVLLAVALIFIAVFAASSRFMRGDKPQLIQTDGEYAEGIDVSDHNGEIDWQLVEESVDFAFIRAGYRGYGTGEIQKDDRLDENLSGAQAAGLKVGVYFYSQAVTVQEARLEAQFVLEAIEGYAVELPVFIDFEYAHGADGELTGRLYEAQLSSEESAKIINAFCSEIRLSGRHAGVYSSSSMLNLHIKSSALLPDIYIWVADYNRAVTYLVAYDILQYTKSGSCPGVNSKSVDKNYWFV